MAFVSTAEIRTPALVVRSQSSVDGATPQLATFHLSLLKDVFREYIFYVSRSIFGLEYICLCRNNYVVHLCCMQKSSL